MDVSKDSISAAMNCLAAMVIEEIADVCDMPLEKAAAEFLSSHTAEQLFNDELKLWWDGPSAIADDYLRESGYLQDFKAPQA